jgi:hypothetical protein
MVAPGTADPPPSSSVADSTPPVDGLMTDQATSDDAHVGRDRRLASAIGAGVALLTPPREGQPDVATGDETSTPLGVLQGFLTRCESVGATPGRLPTSAKDACREAPAYPVQEQSGCRPVVGAHFGLQAGRGSSKQATRGILDAMCSGTLSSSEVEGLDTLFQMFNGHACELLWEDL